MKILLLGGGGREHALAHAITANPKCDTLIAAPGNAGIAELADCVDLDILNPEAVTEFALEEGVDFVVVGPEAPLDAGVSDALRTASVPVFGPSAAAARLESSKAFTKEICDACGAPTAGYRHFADREAALSYLDQVGAPVVIKADGLAAGKGVVVAMDLDTARDAVRDMFGGSLGAAGAEVVIEEFMTGEEASFFVLCDGTDAVAIGTAQDHKRAFDGDAGPNTGGMGAYSPAPILTDALCAQVMETIIRPTLAEMARRGTPYKGVLYAGLMIEDGIARLVEYNVRFGDPECQVLMMRLGAQAFDAMLACAEGRLADIRLSWAPDHAMTVVMAARGYPGAYEKGSRISGLDTAAQDPRVRIYHAGTARTDDGLVAAGGRVLNVTARADTLAEARTLVYQTIERIDWSEGFYRTDIGWRALGT